MPSQDKKIVAETIAVTAATTIALTAIFFLLCYKCYILRRREKDKGKGSFRREDVAATHKGPKCNNPKEANSFSSLRPTNDMCSFSLGKLGGGQIKTTTNNNNNNNNFPKFVFNPSYNENENENEEEEEDDDQEEEKRELDADGEKKKKNSEKFSVYQEQQSEVIVCDEMSNNNNNKAVLHNQTLPRQIQTSFEFTPPVVSSSLIPQSHHASITFTPTLPPPPKRNPPPPPPPPLPPVQKSSGWISSRRTPVATRGRVVNKKNNNNAEESSNGNNNVVGQMKLKPLHWDKVTAGIDHSTVWDEISDGSLRFDDELMESLFGYSTKNRQSSERTNIFSALTKSSSSPPTQIFLLDPRKSQNTAIVLRSLAISRREILDALTDGHQDLGPETLERLTKISPTQEEISKILRFDGNPSKLADAESFLFHVLRAVPSAFARFDAMLFRVTYGNEVSHFRESLQTLESACLELRARGIFLKLLEAILKAGNKMNEGTSRGNAQGFNLNALKKLSDIRSNDGKTTLLHFVVEQVARSEGKKFETVEKPSQDQSVVSGLKSLEGISARELSNVKRAATIEHESLASLCDCLASQATEIRRRLLSSSKEEERGWFWREMKGFLEECEREIEVAREEQKRVMEVVKRTTEYYQAGDSRGDLRGKTCSNGNPFELFVIVKDFLDVVDQVCVETSKKLRQKRNGFSAVVPSPPLSPSGFGPRRPFSNFRFASEKSLSSSESESEDEF